MRAYHPQAQIAVENHAEKDLVRQACRPESSAAVVFYPEILFIVKDPFHKTFVIIIDLFRENGQQRLRTYISSTRVH